ncbi:threonine/serine exporter family protein [Lachnospiraceae bacterium LCP25S3_G4]
MIANIIFPFIGTLAFSILFNVPKRFYVCCGFTGMAGWLMYCATTGITSATVGTFMGTIVVGLLSRILAVWKKCPITVFLVSGIFPLVPGVGVYSTVYNLVSGNLGLSAVKGMESLKIAFAIVLGIVFVVSIPKRWFVVNYWRERSRKRRKLKEESEKMVDEIIEDKTKKETK